MAPIKTPTYDPKYNEPGPFTKFPGEGLPEIKRYITTHDANGEGVFLPSDSGDHHALMGNGRGVYSIIYTTKEAQIDLNDDADLKFAKEPPGLHVPNGTLVRMIDFAPGIESPIHRAMSLDYGTVIEGELEVELDSGEKRIMRRGDVLVNRNALHTWRNTSPDKCARALFILLDIAPMKPIGGKEIKLELGELSHDYAEDH
ncbi:hypothetical protein HYALB_00011072 [Hymenoscyphus albidus]|uniref:Cupin type-2 domain-containing protein n=1 Tax=Hymenoscyphus albidus TaxID=595503 RepID=A0A9N9LJ41_9HELO|nr:hypothetical protein HYALB_00011072 [Hymenoscyphus albidus]